MFRHPDEQCKDGYSGALCLVCAKDYVKQGDTCTVCKDGSSFTAAFVAMLTFALIVFVSSLCIFLWAPTKKNADKGDQYFGQLKILLTFVQILGAMPGTFHIFRLSLITPISNHTSNIVPKIFMRAFLFLFLYFFSLLYLNKPQVYMILYHGQVNS
jgi:hypothetical protein